MKQQTKTAVYDPQLRMEACRFIGVSQPFPNHFHKYYVIGLMENGKRVLSCKGHEYALCKGDVVLFHPGDNHACSQTAGEALDYRGLHISQDVMLELAEEITGTRKLPGFSTNVVRDKEARSYFRTLHQLIMTGSSGFDKEENLFLLLALLIQQYGQPFENCIPECPAEIEKACYFMEQHYAEPVRLEEICHQAGLSKSSLLRAFTKATGVTPYCYLENVRIGQAKRLLEQGVLPMDAALQTGFSDQSHFTNYFRRFIGITPGTYREIFTGSPDKKSEESLHEK